MLHAGLFGWAFFPSFRAIGLVLLLGAALNFWRLLRWRGGATAAEPLLFILHVGYAWLVLGAALLGLSMLDADLPQSAAIHALTAGAIGTDDSGSDDARHARPHRTQSVGGSRHQSDFSSGQPRGDGARRGGVLRGLDHAASFVSACFWIAAFGGFVLSYAPMLIGAPNTR